MAKKNKKSRFGNPAKAAADTAARGDATIAADARLERAMEALSPGFVQWLESQSRPDQAIDASLIIVDDFFDAYRIVEPQTDPTALVPEAVSEVLEAADQLNPLAAMGLRAGMREYVDYLAQAKLWTGTAQDLAAVQVELARVGLADADFAPVDLGEEILAPADYEFADIYIPELTREEILETVQNSPLWKNTVALLAWIGDGKVLSDDGTLRDQAGVAVVLVHSALGKLSDAAKLNTPEERNAERLSLYLQLLNVAGLISIKDMIVQVSEQAAGALSDEDYMIEAMRNIVGYFIFLLTLQGSDAGDYEDWHYEMADWMIQASSQAPPESALLVQALAEPNTVHPDVVTLARDIAAWAEEGLVTVGEFIEVPAAYRPDVFDMLKDDFTLKSVGPGAPLS